MPRNSSWWNFYLHTIFYQRPELISSFILYPDFKGLEPAKGGQNWISSRVEKNSPRRERLTPFYPT